MFDDVFRHRSLLRRDSDTNQSQQGKVKTTLCCPLSTLIPSRDSTEKFLKTVHKKMTCFDTEPASKGGPRQYNVSVRSMQGFQFRILQPKIAIPRYNRRDTIREKQFGTAHVLNASRRHQRQSRSHGGTLRRRIQPVFSGSSFWVFGSFWR